MCCVGRSEQERLKHKTRQAEDHVTGLRRQLDDRSREVEQLTTLSLKGDATLQEYMAQLTVSNSLPKQCIRRLRDLFQNMYIDRSCGKCRIRSTCTLLLEGSWLFCVVCRHAVSLLVVVKAYDQYGGTVCCHLCPREFHTLEVPT